MAPTRRVQDADINALVTAGIRDRTPTGVPEVTNAWGKVWAPSTWRRQAWMNPRIARTEVLSGLVVALALIPEAISFSIIAGVDPRVGLFASFTMAIAISFLGGRPAMISAASSR